MFCLKNMLNNFRIRSLIWRSAIVLEIGGRSISNVSLCAGLTWVSASLHTGMLIILLFQNDIRHFLFCFCMLCDYLNAVGSYAGAVNTFLSQDV